jgi:D-alanyl-D-alanine carboxypeptidase
MNFRFNLVFCALLGVAMSATAQSDTEARNIALKAVHAKTVQKNATASPGTQTLVGLATYPKRNISWGSATGPVNGVSGASVREDTPFRIASVTKTFTAAAVFKLIEQGRFTLTSPIDPLLSPEVNARLKAAQVDTESVTVQQLLGHRSGLFEYANTAEYVGAIASTPAKKWTRIEQLTIALAQGAPLPPNALYLYADTNYIVLGDIIEKATGQTLAASYRSLLNFSALGLRQTYLESAEPAPAGARPRLHSFVQGFDTFNTDASFDTYGGGGLVSTAKDITAFYRALFAGQVISKSSLDEMTSAVSGGGFGEVAYSLGLMPFFIGNHACYGHEGFGSVVAGHCPAIDYTFVYAAGSDLIPEMTLTNRGVGYDFGKYVGVDVRPKPYRDSFERTRCTRELGTATAKLNCGMMTVDEGRGAFESREIRFPVVIAQHPSKPATLEPLLLLGGGPDNALIPKLPALLANPDASSALLDGQDIVVTEYRGVGGATPRLGCDTLVTDDISLTACRHKLLAQRINLDRYNSIEIASDLEALRSALSVSRWNLLGFSYGTHVALTMLRERGHTIKSLSLDGVDSPDTPFSDPESFARTLDSIFASCSSQAPCNAAFPNLKSRFVDTLIGLNQTPLQINGFALNGDTLVQLLTPFQGTPELLLYLPAVIDGFAKKNNELLQYFTFNTTSTDVSADTTFSVGMFYSAVCNERLPFSNRASLLAQSSGVDPIRRSIANNMLKQINYCAQWPSGRASNRVNQAVPITVPTIVLNAQFDLQTSPEVGRKLAASSSRARAFEFPAVGHIATQQSPACAVSIIADFQRKQNVGAIDASCIATLPSVEWKTSIDEGLAKLLGG